MMYKKKEVPTQSIGTKIKTQIIGTRIRGFSSFFLVHHSIVPVFHYSNCERSELSSIYDVNGL